MECALGGGVSAATLDFMRRLPTGCLDRYETRKVVFGCPEALDGDADKGILKAVGFELMWLKNKRDFYGCIFEEDHARIDMLQGRYDLMIEAAAGGATNSPDTTRPPGPIQGIRGVVFDVDGTLLLADEAVAGAPEAVDAVRADGYKVLFLTNASGRTVSDIVGALLAAGVSADEGPRSTLPRRQRPRGWSMQVSPTLG